MSNVKDVMLYIVLPVLAIAFAGVLTFFRVSGDLEVCRLYYPQMNRFSCYMSEKTVRTPSGK